MLKKFHYQSIELQKKKKNSCKVTTNYIIPIMICNIFTILLFDNIKKFYTVNVEKLISIENMYAFITTNLHMLKVNLYV